MDISKWTYMVWMQLGLYVMELAACVTGLVYWRKIKNSYWKWFPVYLGIIFLLEVQNHFLHWLPNMVTVNQLLVPLEFIFFYWLFYRYFKTGRYWPVAAGLVFLIIWVLENMVLGLVKGSFITLSYMSGNLLLVALVMYFFIKLTFSEQILYYRDNMMFWVCIGILLFYLLTLPFFGLYFNMYKKMPGLFNTYRVVMMVLNYIMYGCFITGFICSKKN